MPVGDGPPPGLVLDFGKKKHPPVPIDLQDVEKCKQIKEWLDKIRAAPGFTEFMLRYPDFQYAIAETYRVIDGMAVLGEAMHTEFKQTYERLVREQKE